MYYLILNKKNKIVGEKATKNKAKLYVKNKPNLRYEAFEYVDNKVACDLDGVL